jgi:hypothetical protein
MVEVKMKKIILTGLLTLMLIIPIAGATNTIIKNEKTSSAANDAFTHTVFIEYGSLTTCGPCVTASAQLYSIYQSGDLDFIYGTLVFDAAGTSVKQRLQELGVSSVPDVFFDGKYRHIIGSQPSETTYRNAISQAGARVVPDFDINLDVTWVGGGTLTISVSVINNEPDDYKGVIRIYILEKESRWNDNSGNPYHYAVLDIPLDRSLSLNSGQSRPLGDTYDFTKTWIGSLYGFGDITIDNTMVIAAVFDADTDYIIESAAGEPTSDSGNYRLQGLIFTRFLNQILNRFPILNNLFNL